MQHSEFFERVRLSGNPQPQPDSVVVSGNARFTVLTQRLLRLEWSPTGEFTDLATFTFPNRRVEWSPTVAVREDGVHLWIETGALTLSYRLESGAFTSENLAITFHLGEEIRTWRPGEQDSGNLGGTRRTLDFTGGDVPLEPGLLSRDGWTLFDDSASVLLRPDDGWVSARLPQSTQDWYFFGYGHAYTDALAEYTLFGGAVPLIPRYVLGIWWSRFWPYSDTELERLVNDFAAHSLPLDVLVIDMDWHLPGRWTGYTWNHELFPDPESFLAAMHEQGLRITLNLHPADGVHPHEEAYPEIVRALGMSEANRVPVPFSITDRQFAEVYFTLLHHPMEDQGVDFWWIDWQQGERSDISGVDPLLWLNHLHFADARRRGQRPLIFSRWSGLGNHRYPIGFSGDTFGGWATLSALPYFTATAANVGFGWWSHDIGGHFGAVGPELFTRWIQFAALSPCLRLHSAKHQLAERRPWAFPTEALNAIRKAFELRYHLVPYLYTMARYTHERGVALCRPMYYAYPQHESAYSARGQYQLGDDLLAAPITEPADAQTNLATKDVWIPPGTWYRFDTGVAFVGPRWVRITGNLETIPLLARAGAIVPTTKSAMHLVDVPNDWLEIRIFPGGEGTFRLYEDDGSSLEYLHGDYEWTTFSTSTALTEGSPSTRLRIDPVEGYCRSLPDYRGYTLTFVGVDHSPVQVVDENGDALNWSYDQVSHRLQVILLARPKQMASTVDVQWSVGVPEDELEVPDNAGTLPFAHVIASTARDESEHQLARLILVPPYALDREPESCDAEIVWSDMSYMTVLQSRQTVTNLKQELTLTAPLALGRSLQPRHWQVEYRFATGNEALTPLTSTFNGPYINPPIQRWNLRYSGQRNWGILRADVAERLTITEPFEANLDPTQASNAEATAIIELAEPTTIWFDTWTNGSLGLQVDGKVLNGGAEQPTLAGLARPWPIVRFGPVALAPGIHSIQTQLMAPVGAVWVFGVLLLDDAGLPLYRCAQKIEESPEATH